MPKVSVLVPVYNVERYIGRCARSIFRQTFQDWEAIFVDDASPDASMQELERAIGEFPALHGKVKTIQHEKNRGSAAARATALKEATGEYVLFVDSDDFITTDMLAKMVTAARKEQADLTICNYVEQTAAGERVVDVKITPPEMLKAA